MAQATTAKAAEKTQAPPDRGLAHFIKIMGPAIITVLSWLGAGDIINAAVSGANYGYALMWVLVVANLVRFIIVNTMTRFELMNRQGKSLISTLAGVSKVFPVLFFVAPLIMGNLTIGYILKGAAQSFGWLLGFGNETLWSAVLGVIIIAILGRSVLAKLETFFKVCLSVLVVIFIVLAIQCQPNPGDIAQGLFMFQIPASDGAYDVMLVILGMVGATAGSLGNLFHGVNLAEGGVRDASQMKGQTRSLLISLLVTAVLVLCVWIVGADILRPHGLEVTSLQDIGLALEMYLGPVGAKIFYLGIFAALFTSAAGNTVGFTKLAIANFNELFPQRESRTKIIQEDRFFPILVAVIIASAYVWSLPSMPGQVFMTLFTNALNVAIVPIIAISVLVVTNSKKLMGEHTNNIFENVVLVGTTVLAIASVVQTVL